MSREVSLDLVKLGEMLEEIGLADGAYPSMEYTTVLFALLLETRRRLDELTAKVGLMQKALDVVAPGWQFGDPHTVGCQCASCTD